MSDTPSGAIPGSIDAQTPDKSSAPKGSIISEVIDGVKKAIAGLQDKGFLVPVAIIVAAILFAYWPLVIQLPKKWLESDGYYSHGFLVPFISGYIIYRWWPNIKDRPAATSWTGFAFLFVCLLLSFFAAPAAIAPVQSFAMVVSLLCGIWFVAGWGWFKALFFPTAYLGFALPIFGPIIERYTNPLQLLSTQIAYWLLQTFGFELYKGDTTTIYMDHFVLDVGVPCSGLRLVLAITAFTVFFIMIGRLSSFANLIMASLILPLCLFINGLRIALIGVVGELYGHDAGMKFHDYSGYITIVVCFLILFKVARWLGWKD